MGESDVNMPFDVLESLMKKLFVILIVAGGLMHCSVTKANITGIDYASDGDGAIVCNVYTWNGSLPEFTAGTIDGIQYSAPAHVIGNIETDGSDPTLTLNSTINNDTGFAWTAYDVNVYMSSTFTLSAENVTLPPDWTAAITQSPVWNGSQYEGKLEFTGVTPVANGDNLDFGYTISFSGYTSFTFCQEMIPVPEPGTFGFLSAGALLLGGFLAAGRRKNHS